MNIVALLALQLIAVGAISISSLPKHMGQQPPQAYWGMMEATQAMNANKLRGSDESAPELEVASPPAPKVKPAADDRGERGHFYYAENCNDCFYKQNAGQCGCQPAVEYFACLNKHCHDTNINAKAHKQHSACLHLSDQCSSELTIECKGPDTVCEGKYNQLPSGGLGLTIDPKGISDDAYCGPNGKCSGELHMKVIVHAAKTLFPVSAQLQELHAASASAPAPATAAAPVAPPAPTTTTTTTTTTPAIPAGTWVECGLPNKADAKYENAADWTTCHAEVVDGKAACDIPMFATLQASKSAASYCVLTEGNSGDAPSVSTIESVKDAEVAYADRKAAKRLTAPAWRNIINHHKAVGMAHSSLLEEVDEADEESEADVEEADEADEADDENDAEEADEEDETDDEDHDEE